MKKVDKWAGFTLIEAMAVLVLMGILLLVAVPNVSKMIDQSQFTKENDYAKTIYLAAQTELTRLYNNGQLPEIIDRLGSECKLAPEEMGVDKNSLNGANIYYMMISKDDPDLTENGAKVLYDILSGNVFDDVILAGSICVEFDADTGSVYSVSFSDKASHFYYNNEGQVDNGVSLYGTWRDAKNREKHDSMYGYYSSSVIDSAPKTQARSFTTCELVNSDALIFRFGHGNTGVINVDYTVELLNGNDVLSTFNFTGNEIANAVIGNNRVIGKTPSGGNYEFYVWRENTNGSNDVVYDLILDGIDFGILGRYGDAAGFMGSLDDGYRMKMSQTYSLTRFDLKQSQPEAKIRVRVTASNTGEYKFTSKGRTNQSSAYFGDKSDSDKIYIENARHLYNMRLNTDLSGNLLGAEYIQTNDIDWTEAVTAGQDGAKSERRAFLYGKNIEEGKDEGTVNRNFPSVDTFPSNAVYSGGSKAIRNMTVDNDYSLSQGNINEGAGLFRINNGVVEKLKLENINVNADSYAGVLCGKNTGVLREITASGSVKGSDSGVYIGGVCGIDGSSAEPERYVSIKSSVNVYGGSDVGGILGGTGAGALVMKDCSNAGKVTANSSYAGGITGRLLTGTSVKDVSNSGEITADASYAGGICGESSIDLDFESTANSGKIFAPEYSGGICGINSANITGKAGADINTGLVTADIRYAGGIAGYNSGNIVNCSSRNSFEADSETFSYSKRADRLKGDYVGGIAGYNKGLISSSDSSGGYIMGKTNVGGICGYSDTDIASVQNSANVVGMQFVGGITGKLDAGRTIAGCTNRGAVLSSEGYSGGIAGSNYGTINECVNNNAVKGMAANIPITSWNMQGDFAGGICGVNAGSINLMSGGTALEQRPYVFGGSYTGGLVGYNNSQNDFGISSSAIKGAYVSGLDCVGGAVGLNGAFGGNVRMDAEIIKINGRYMAGGIFGANLPKDINGEMNVEAIVTGASSSGNINADGVAGGVVGFNYCVPSYSSAFDVVYQSLMYLNGGFGAGIFYTKTCGIGNPTPPGASNVRINYSGCSNGLENVRNGVDLNVKHGGGGIVGVSSSEVITVFDSCANYGGVVKASEPLKNWVYDEHADDFVEYIDSYSGGIIGANTAQTTIRNCITTVIPYSSSNRWGVICQSNDGTIENCTVTLSEIDLNNDYWEGNESGFGGITGINKGAIVNSSVSGRIVVGNDDGDVPGSNIGGIAVYNEGNIHGCDLSIQIDAPSGDYVGGAAAHNKGRIWNVSVSGNGVSGRDFVGGISGRNYSSGWIAGVLDPGSDEEHRGVIVECQSVSGAKNVGGIAGENAGNITGMYESVNNSVYIHPVSNKSSVSASEANAGGIAGNGLKASVIDNCENYGKVVSGQYAGGIIGSNQGAIDNCKLQGSQISDSSKQGGSGGIAGISYKTDGSVKIEYKNGLSPDNVYTQSNVTVTKEFSNGTVKNCAAEDSVIQSADCAGGIAGYSSGDISGSAAIGCTVTGKTTGGIAGCQAGGSIMDCKAGSGLDMTSAENAGGIIGNAQNGVEVKSCRSSCISYNYGKNGFWGICGTTDFSMENCFVYTPSVVTSGDAFAPGAIDANGSYALYFAEYGSLDGGINGKYAAQYGNDTGYDFVWDTDEETGEEYLKTYRVLYENKSLFADYYDKAAGTVSTELAKCRSKSDYALLAKDIYNEYL